MIAFDLRVGGVDVAEDLGARGFAGLLALVDVDEGALLFALVAIEDAQRNVDAGAERLGAVGIVVGGVVGVPAAEGGIGRAVGDGQLVIGFGLLNGLERGLQIGPGIEGDLAEVVERLQARRRNRMGPRRRTARPGCGR